MAFRRLNEHSLRTVFIITMVISSQVNRHEEIEMHCKGSGDHGAIFLTAFCASKPPLVVEEEVCQHLHFAACKHQLRK